MAVLLDNFVSASSMIEDEESQILLEEKRQLQLARNPLEPLLKKISKEFVDDSDLSNKLHHLYKVSFISRVVGKRITACMSELNKLRPHHAESQADYSLLRDSNHLQNELGIGQVLDSDGSGLLSASEFCASIKKLVRCSTLLAVNNLLLAFLSVF